VSAIEMNGRDEKDKAKNAEKEAYQQERSYEKEGGGKAKGAEDEDESW
jgi:hypothetical protein